MSDDLHFSITLLATRDGLAFWGYATYASATVVLAGGIALLGIGMAMLIKRLSYRPPHQYDVTVCIYLNNVSDHLQQFLSNGA